MNCKNDLLQNLHTLHVVMIGEYLFLM